jgi:ankyrin repeat protein
MQKQWRKEELEKWLNLPSFGEDGFTALHFASFHGNGSLIKFMVKHGADIYAKNRQGINMLHVAVQGD